EAEPVAFLEEAHVLSDVAPLEHLRARLPDEIAIVAGRHVFESIASRSRTRQRRRRPTLPHARHGCRGATRSPPRIFATPGRRAVSGSPAERQEAERRAPKRARPARSRDRRTPADRARPDDPRGPLRRTRRRRAAPRRARLRARQSPLRASSCRPELARGR